MEASRSTVTKEVGRTLAVVGAVALLAVVAAVLLAVRQANRLASPLTDLAETAERLGSGDPRPRHKRYGVPELDRVADVLDSSAERIGRMLTAERRLAADASHQLRTPLTALSMRLEEITVTDDLETVREEATIALTQVERLTDVVERLLTNSRDRGPARRSPSTSTRSSNSRWRSGGRPTAAPGGPSCAPGRRGCGRSAPPARSPRSWRRWWRTRSCTGRHGRAAHPGHRQPGGTGGHGRGTRRPPDLGNRIFERAISGRNSTGIGLAVARDLAEADGGRLELLQSQPPVFALFLSRTAPERPEPAQTVR